jgi:5-oxopent-3-ene-1,2,5-tricarboxylate decarboxylase/2-hydroxyhepta-2,4-diene-1,7-dioate isomerase
VDFVTPPAEPVMTEHRRILLDGACVQVVRDGDELVAGDGRRVAVAEAVHLPPCVPTKIVAVHLNHSSRVAEFGARLPAAPTYFHKPVSALVGHGGAVVRPARCQYLNYEGEIAIVIGRPCRGITPEQAGDYIAGYTIANDFGLHDFRDTDAGSMLRVKGSDTMAPLGPGLVTGWDFRGKRLRTYVNGAVMQNGTTDEMTWDMHYLVADIARTITLLPGDVLLSGTPANSRPARPASRRPSAPSRRRARRSCRPRSAGTGSSAASGPRPGAEARCTPFRPYHRPMPRRFAIGSAQDLVQAERDIRARIGDSELDFAAMAAVSNIYRAANAIRNHMEQQVLAEEDLSWAAFTVLFVLWIWGDQQTRHLAAEAGVTKGTLTGVLKTLEKRGLARRRGHDADGRLVLVSLEPKGQEVIERLFPAFNHGEAQVSGGLTAREKDQLASLLRTIIRTVEEDD